MEPDRAAPAGNAPATGEIEITPEMIEAGAEVIFECFGEAVGWRSSYCPYVARQVFLAMDSRRPLRGRHLPSDGKP